MRQFLTESILLSGFGGVVGVILAIWGTSLLVGLAPERIPRLSETHFDGGILLFTFLITTATGIRINKLLRPATRQS